MITLLQSLVMGWTRAYTRGMPSMWADERRSEIESDLWELLNDPDGGRGVSPAIHIIARLLAGIPDDISWRLDRTTFDDNVFFRKAITAAAVAMFVLVMSFASPSVNASAVTCASNPPPRTPRLAQVVACVGALLGSPIAQAGQTAPQPKPQSQAFEVISIKPARSSDPRDMRLRVLPNGDLNASAVPVLLLVSYAYDVPLNPSPRLAGLPGWRETYDLAAKARANAVPAGLPESEKRRRTQGMVRGLLADRFKLVMRVEQKTMPVYAVIVASGGASLQKSTIAEKDCMFDTGTPESCHNFAEGRGFHALNARAITIDDLASYIENWTDLPAVNRTTLSGLFAVETEGWRPMRLPPRPPGLPQAPNFDDLPTIFTVLGKLGLELKQQEATVPAYTVEHIERPAGE